ncbi:MAG: rod shape-determining protein [Candidatus Latescibacterota bacterium]|nr:MAG: rod shape-determining protein [Candidatus Latescibacterota bacterium]RKY74542.1 MAG: rod shape-determining protein [Candidatus Latescibacterota bacterium]HDH99445.1 rod shape-determining protein [Bacillota bacterium]
MRFSFGSFFSNDVGVDLGTANTLVYVKGEGIVVNEPSIVALDRDRRKLVAVGAEAREMMGRTPENIVTVRPLKDGVIADFDVAEEMLRYFIRRAQRNRFLVRPRVVVCVPSGITEVEKRAVRDAAERAGAREVFLVAEPMAAAIGVGLPVNEPVGSMVIDIGGGTSEIAVISLSGVVTHVSERVGGDEMDQAIVQFMKKAHNLLIGERMAEQIKVQIGSAYPLEKELEMPVKGRDLIANIPKTVVVRSEEVREALQEPVNIIVNATRMALERTPPELSSDILDRGVIMTGGGSLLKGLDRRLREETGLPVSVMDDPLTCVARGAGKILENIEEYRKVLF